MSDKRKFYMTTQTDEPGAAKDANIEDVWCEASGFSLHCNYFHIATAQTRKRDLEYFSVGA